MKYFAIFLFALFLALPAHADLGGENERVESDLNASGTLVVSDGKESPSDKPEERKQEANAGYCCGYGINSDGTYGYSCELKLTGCN